MLEHDPLISEYEHEKFRPREADALQTLRKVASLVKPIMRQRGWKVGILTEFWPPEKNLLGLNWNKGQKICLRLRYPHDERQFIPLEEVVDTMLHEYEYLPLSTPIVNTIISILTKTSLPSVDSAILSMARTTNHSTSFGTSCVPSTNSSSEKATQVKVFSLPATNLEGAVFPDTKPSAAPASPRKNAAR